VTRWFITGTDTGVGKTRAACALIRHLAGLGQRVAGLKPVASGCAVTSDGLRNEDALALMEAANVELDYSTVNPYAFGPAIAPHLAAAAAGVEIDLGAIARIANGVRADHVVIEGAGGWAVPLDRTRSFADLAAEVCDAVILVVGMRLGCINHALLSAAQINRDGCRLAGWVANILDPAMPVLAGNLETLEDRLEPPLLAVLPWDPGGSAAVKWAGIC